MNQCHNLYPITDTLDYFSAPQRVSDPNAFWKHLLTNFSLEAMSLDLLCDTNIMLQFTYLLIITEEGTKCLTNI